MLVLSRKANERLILPTLGVSIEVVRIQGSRTTLGIDAPPEVPILREEIAGLKSVEFSPDEAGARTKLSKLSSAVRQKLESCAEALNLLHEHLQTDTAAQSLVLDIFRDLRDLDREAQASIDDTNTITTPYALLIGGHSGERELLASCLRFGGLEVAEAADGEDAINYLSLHACPDVALFDPQQVGEDVVVALRAQAGCEGMKLFGLGVEVSSHGERGLDRCFPRPLNAESLVDELVRELGQRTAI